MDTDNSYILERLVFPTRSLYPGLEGRFVLESIPSHVMTSLKEAAKSRGRYSNHLMLRILLRIDGASASMTFYGET